MRRRAGAHPASFLAGADFPRTTRHGPAGAHGCVDHLDIEFASESLAESVGSLEVSASPSLIAFVEQCLDAPPSLLVYPGKLLDRSRAAALCETTEIEAKKVSGCRENAIELVRWKAARDGLAERGDGAGRRQVVGERRVEGVDGGRPARSRYRDGGSGAPSSSRRPSTERTRRAKKLSAAAMSSIVTRTWER
jgi:hypothetical protein